MIVGAMELVVPVQAAVGEGPLWDTRTMTLYWVDLMGYKLHAYHPATGRHTTIAFDQCVGCVVPRVSGGFVLAMQKGFYTINDDGGALTELAVPSSYQDGNWFNDGKCDPAGRLWAGAMSAAGEPNDGIVYCLHPDLQVTEKIGQVTISNGLGWSPDHQTMYYIDSQTRNVTAYDYDAASGTIGNARIAVAFAEEDGLPDGMTVDEAGMIWVAHWGGAKVTRSDPKSGERLAAIPVPALFVTSCAFGGHLGDELYITTARAGMDEQQLRAYPDAGGLFRIRTGIKGMPAYAFKG